MSLYTFKPGSAEKVFYSYAQKDERLRNELDKHLSNLRRLGLIFDWHNRNISAGMEWELEIDTQLNTADIILLLISPDYMASEYCYSVEMERAMERHEEREARVVPILLRPVDWEGSLFSKLQFLPTNKKPVTLWRNLDQAFLNIAKGIRMEINELRDTRRDRKTSNALPIYEDRIKINIALLLLDKGETLYRSGRYHEALEAVEQSLSNDRDSAFAHVCKGDTLLQLNRFEEALESYERAIRLNINYSYAYQGKGFTLVKLGKSEEAKQAFETARQLDTLG